MNWPPVAPYGPNVYYPQQLKSGSEYEYKVRFQCSAGTWSQAVIGSFQTVPSTPKSTPPSAISSSTPTAPVGSTPQPENEIFTAYNWLSSIGITESNCTSGTTITEYLYSNGSTKFVFVEKGSEPYGTLYLDNGTYYCTSSSQTDCLALYNLKSVISSWSCGG